ncbi:PREDICTED: uncharacterized protein LOC108559597 [Nicrophorus vespilloides]|uniref:Uncharacterized protein LOC108559597 n=1 Tax=Nicrophorus vespilloides TaxID=110193 RepID=A0ABM1MCW7_NICVS|nr:PREDICTED: uncharacterized protein LOC108559597 [Nicrophorus vespilloides]
MKYFVFALILLTGYCMIPVKGQSRRASVKLFMHDLSNAGLPTRIVGGAFSLTGHGGKHWAVVVQFEGDDLVYLCELHRDPNTGRKGSGGIVWSCERMTKEEVMRGKTGIYIHEFRNIHTTPEELYRICSEIRFNGTDYHLILNNCQHWSKELIHKLGLSITWFNMKTLMEKTTGPGFLITHLKTYSL